MIHRFYKGAAIAAASFVSLVTVNASAQTYNVIFATGNTGGTKFDAAIDNGFQSATGNKFVYATFQYTGPLTFNVGASGTTGFTNDLNSAFFSKGTISNFASYGSNNGGSLMLTGPSSANFTSLSTFLASSGSASGFQYGSIMSFDLGTLTGGTKLTISHDDGASVYQGADLFSAKRVGTTVAGPTTLVTDQVTLPASGNTFVVYARENSAPSTLDVSVAAVPEPASWAMMILGMGAVGYTLRRKVRASDARFDARIKRIATGEAA